MQKWVTRGGNEGAEAHGWGCWRARAGGLESTAEGVVTPAVGGAGAGRGVLERTAEGAEARGRGMALRVSAQIFARVCMRYEKKVVSLHALSAVNCARYLLKLHALSAVKHAGGRLKGQKI